MVRCSTRPGWPAGPWWWSWTSTLLTSASPSAHLGPVHALSPGFTFWRERLHFLVWANTYDARAGEPVWWHGRRAARRLAVDGVAAAGRPT